MFPLGESTICFHSIVFGNRYKNEPSLFLCNRCTHIPKSEQFTLVRCCSMLWLYNASLFIFRFCLRLALHNQNTDWRWENEKYRISATRSRHCTYFIRYSAHSASDRYNIFLLRINIRRTLDTSTHTHTFTAHKSCSCTTGVSVFDDTVKSIRWKSACCAPHILVTGVL